MTASAESLRTIDAQVTRPLIELVLYGVRRDDFDIGVDELGRARAGSNAVPGMRLE